MELILVLWILYLCYRTYSCISVLIFVIRSIFLYFGSYTYVMELILVFRILYLYYGAYSCTSDLIRSLFLYKSTHRYYTDSLYRGTRRYYWSYTYITELILILQNLYLFYLYESTRRYYRDFTCTKVPIGTTEHIQRYCHTPDPGPTRLADPYRSSGRDTVYTIYILYCTGTLIDLFFLRADTCTCSIQTISVITKIIYVYQKNYHRSGVLKSLYTYTESYLLIQILIQYISNTKLQRLRK